MDVAHKTAWSPDIVTTLKPEFFNKSSIQYDKNNLVLKRSRRGHEETDNFEYIERFIDRLLPPIGKLTS